jgi:hypothetical protein
MAKIVIASIVASLIIAGAVCVAAVMPLRERPIAFKAAGIVCWLDWPVSKLTNRLDMSWQGLALYADPQGCRGIAPQMNRIYMLQGLWSSVVYAPLFIGVGAVARRKKHAPN